jgi:hypothetical protein
MQNQQSDVNQQDLSVIHHLILLDRSASMRDIRYGVIAIFNQYLQRLKEDSSDVKKHVITFYSFAKPRLGVVLQEHYRQVDACNVNELDLESYQPKGDTPLNDAIVRASRLLYTQLELSGVVSKVNFTIITDGKENASVVETDDTVKTWILMLQNKGWEIEYLGLGINPERDSINKGIRHHKSFDKNPDGMMAFLTHINSKI